MLYAKVKTCSKRPESALKSIDTIGLSKENIWYDLREIDLQYKNKSYSWNTAKGWESFKEINCSHCMFMDDDLDFCYDFLNICEKIINANPNATIGLFPA